MSNDVLKQLVSKREHFVVPFQHLMPRRIRNILLVASNYDSFTFEEDGHLSEVLFSDYLELNLRYAPQIDKVSTAHEALERLQSDRYDLVISMLRVGDMNQQEFGRRAQAIQPGLPIVLLTFSQKELAILESEDLSTIERVFMWSGDVRLFLAIIKCTEDRLNAWHDARAAGVQCLILVEDSVKFYSSYLPMLYTEIMMQTRTLMADGANRMQQLLRMHVRPKVLLATSYEEALSHYNQYQDHLLGAIVDAGFPRNGKHDPTAGRDFAELVRKEHPDCAVLIQSSDAVSAEFAQSMGAEFINKNSPSFLHELREFMKAHLGFGDFVFRRPDGTVVTRAGDLRSLAEAIRTIPEESLIHHCGRNDISTWLMARTEFGLAKAIRARKTIEFSSLPKLRDYLISSLKIHRTKSRAGIVSDFSSAAFEADSYFVRIGTGSLGGKGRGLAFFNSLFTDYNIENHVPGVRLFIPATAVLATGIFDQVMESERLTDLVLGEAGNQEIADAFMSARLPEKAREALRAFLARVKYPLAVRSSSLLEDASYQPFAGVYQTYMIPNNHERLEERLAQLTTAVKLVYASTFYTEAREYLAITPNRLEEEKMAVVIQEVVGRRHGRYLYPDIAGVARSHNFYPIGDMTPNDGVVCAVLGLGRTVVDGGRCMRFSPKRSASIFDIMATRDFVNSAQRDFWALDLEQPEDGDDRPAFIDSDLTSLDLDEAAEHGTFDAVGSVYSHRDQKLRDGDEGHGVRLVTLAKTLKNDDVKLGEAISFLLSIGRSGLSWPVEIEFAMKLNTDGSGPHELGFLQIRPMSVTISQDEVENIPEEQIVCRSHQSLGPGRIEPVTDLVYVVPESFNRAVTPDIADEVGLINERLKEEERRYVLIGPGRWGSTDWRLGIPVTWGQITNVNCLVETELKGLKVTPSQGSHFFHNITSFGVRCLTVNYGDDGGMLDHEWLDRQKIHFETEHLRHLRFDSPMQILVDGRSGLGVVLKPDNDQTEPGGINIP